MSTAVVERTKRLYAHDAIALTAGEWALHLELGFDEFWDYIIEHNGDVEAAIAEIIVLLNTPDFESEVPPHRCRKNHPE